MISIAEDGSRHAWGVAEGGWALSAASGCASGEPVEPVECGTPKGIRTPDLHLERVAS
jgi:hypothetical protein